MWSDKNFSLKNYSDAMVCTLIVVIKQGGLGSEGRYLSLQGTEMEVDVVREFGADETVRLLLEKLHFYENKIR